MTTLTLTLPDDRVRRLEQLAQAAGVSREELLQAKAEQWLAEPDDEFLRAARRVLEKNAELYRRLA
jgi:predicted transcriptional regulator